LRFSSIPHYTMPSYSFSPVKHSHAPRQHTGVLLAAMNSSSNYFVCLMGGSGCADNQERCDDIIEAYPVSLLESDGMPDTAYMDSLCSRAIRPRTLCSARTTVNRSIDRLLHPCNIYSWMDRDRVFHRHRTLSRKALLGVGNSMQTLCCRFEGTWLAV